MVGDNIKQFDIDVLKLYRGNPYKVNDEISIRIPTLGEICDYDEVTYYSMVHTLCAVGLDICWQLEEIGVPYDEISDYNLFATFLCRGYDISQTKILFGDKLDFSKMQTYVNPKTNAIELVQKYLLSVPLRNRASLKGECVFHVPSGSYVELLDEKNTFSHIRYDDKTGYVMSVYLNKDGDKFIISEPSDPNAIGDGFYNTIIINEEDYSKLVSCLRSMHGMTRNNAIAGSTSCRRAFIEDAKDAYLARKNEPRKSYLMPMVSTMVNSEGFKHSDKDVWDMNIYAFMDSVKRISKIRNVSLLLQSGYSGFGIDLNKIKDKDNQLNYMGELK